MSSTLSASAGELRIDLKNVPKGEYVLILYGEKGEILKREGIIKR